MDLDFKSLTGDKAVDEARALRVLMAVLEGDMTQLAYVAEDVARDTRPFDTSLWELVLGMAGAVAEKWLETTDVDTLKSSIRLAILDREDGEG